MYIHCGMYALLGNVNCSVQQTDQPLWPIVYSDRLNIINILYQVQTTSTTQNTSRNRLHRQSDKRCPSARTPCEGTRQREELTVIHHS